MVDKKWGVPSNGVFLMSHLLADECCINVHVSSLLEHWLDWDRPPLISSVLKGGIQTKESPNTDLEGSQGVESVSNRKINLNPSSIEGWVRQISSNGCDVNRQDLEGRTLLHLLLNGKTRHSHSFGLGTPYYTLF